MNLLIHLNIQFRDRPFEGLGPELRLKVSPTGLYTYPDVMILSIGAKSEDTHNDTMLDPCVIFEVLSDSTESYDRGKKFAHYRSLDFLKEYFLVSQKEFRIERFARQEDGNWLYSEVTDPQGTIEVASVACRLPMSQIYERVRFEDSE